MLGLSVVRAVVVVVAAVVLPGAAALTLSPGLSWCAESTKGIVRVTKSEKPELGQIPVLVNNTMVVDIVEEVFVRAPPTCGETTLTQEVIDGLNAVLVWREGEFKLFWVPPDTVPILQEAEDFCITTTGGNSEEPLGTLMAKFCFPSASQQKEAEMLTCSGVSCIRKCCPPNTAMSGDGLCAEVADGEAWRPSMLSRPDAADYNVTMLYGPPRSCANALTYNEFYITPEGKLELEDIDSLIDVDYYCVDSPVGRWQAVALVCDVQVTDWKCEWKSQVLKPVLLGVSSVCLLIVWFVYVSVARLRNSNIGRCLLSMVSALFVAHLCLITLGFTSADQTSLFCVIAGRLCHFAFLAGYFWMNVLSILTFFKLKSQMDDKWERPRVFLFGSLYAWCCPLVFVVVGEVLDAAQANSTVPYMANTCWFYERYSYWAYLYGPMLVLLLVNLGLFVGCVVVIAGGRRLVTFTPCTDHHHICSAWLYVRLFILMGILWLTEIAAWLFLEYCSIPEWIIDTINSLQGVLVFLVTVCFRGDLKILHRGRPKLIPKGGQDLVPTSTEDASEMTSVPLVK